MQNLITDITYVKSVNGTSIDVLLTNKSRCFHRPKHAPIKKKNRDNEAPFTTKELSTAIMNRSNR